MCVSEIDAIFKTLDNSIGCAASPPLYSVSSAGGSLSSRKDPYQEEAL